MPSAAFQPQSVLWLPASSRRLSRTLQNPPRSSAPQSPHFRFQGGCLKPSFQASRTAAAAIRTASPASVSGESGARSVPCCPAGACCQRHPLASFRATCSAPRPRARSGCNRLFPRRSGRPRHSPCPKQSRRPATSPACSSRPTQSGASPPCEVPRNTLAAAVPCPTPFSRSHHQGTAAPCRSSVSRRGNGSCRRPRRDRMAGQQLPGQRPHLAALPCSSCSRCSAVQSSVVAPNKSFHRTAFGRAVNSGVRRSLGGAFIPFVEVFVPAFPGNVRCQCFTNHSHQQPRLRLALHAFKRIQQQVGTLKCPHCRVGLFADVLVPVVESFS